jgi:hypothetical protein
VCVCVVVKNSHMFTTRTQTTRCPMRCVLYDYKFSIHIVVKDTFWHSAWILMLELVEKIEFLATHHGYHKGLQH